MIKHHPSLMILGQFARGELHASLAVAVAAHVELCPCCQSTVKQFEQVHAEFELGAETNSVNTNFDAWEDEFGDVLDTITSDESRDEVVLVPATSLHYQNRQVHLPKVLAHLPRSEFMQLGKIARARFTLEDDNWRTSLLHIAPGGEIPNHTHTGQELTLLLDGEFSDEFGHYVAGDFILLDGEHHHTPRTENGCLCLTVVNSALHFNKGLSKLLNPIGDLIY